MFRRNKEGIQIIIKIYEDFSKISEFKFNVGKIEIMTIGATNPAQETIRIKFKGTILNIVTQNTVNICGITSSNDKDLAYEQNILNKITKMERQLNIWKERNVSLEGKILLVHLG